MVLLLSTSILAFAAPSSNMDIPVTLTNQAVLTTPEGNKILINNISAEGKLKDENLEVSLKGNIVRNRVVINRNATTPIFSFEEGGSIHTDSSLTISKSYSPAQAMMWLDVSKAKQDAIYKKLSDSNRIFVKWRNTCQFTVESAYPISITDSIGDGKQMAKSISEGTYTLTYNSNSGESTIWSGYLTFRSGTVMFNGGANFLKN